MMIGAPRRVESYIRDGLVAISLLLLTGGCISPRLYQDSLPEYAEQGQNYDLMTIEYDDVGEPWVASQAIEALTAVHRANASEAGCLLVLFVHGWKHNAGEMDENRINFRNTLDRLAALEAATAASKSRGARRVVGVYIAWRGDSLRLPEPLKALSFFDRFAAARRVASSPSVTQAILGLIHLSRQNAKSRSIVIGHSFGALILEQALAQPFAAAIAEVAFAEKRAARLATEWTPPADLIVVVNEAAPAILAKSLIDSFRLQNVYSTRDSNPRFVCGGSPEWTPIIVSVTSVRDRATKYAFPIGSGLESWSHRFREYGDDGFTDDSESESRRLPSQRYFYTHTPGHVEVLQSHEVQVQTVSNPPSVTPQPCSLLDCSQTTVPANSPQDEVCFDVGTHRFTLSQKGHETINNTPYWIMRVPTSVSAHHGDIFNPVFMSFLLGIVEVSSALNPDTEDYMNTAWCIWHEGVRVYDQSYPGMMRPLEAIRGECMAMQDHNPNAQEIIQRLSDADFLAITTSVSALVDRRQQLAAKFEAVMRGPMGDRFSELVEAGNYEEIRRLYARAAPDPNSRNLLAAVSNQRIRELVQANE